MQHTTNHVVCSTLMTMELNAFGQTDQINKWVWWWSIIIIVRVITLIKWGHGNAVKCDRIHLSQPFIEVIISFNALSLASSFSIPIVQYYGNNHQSGIANDFSGWVGTWFANDFPALQMTAPGLGLWAAENFLSDYEYLSNALDALLQFSRGVFEINGRDRILIIINK